MFAQRLAVPTSGTLAEPPSGAPEPANQSSQRPRLIVASELRLLRDGLAEALARQADMRVVSVASDAGEVRAAVRAHAPDVLLLDAGLAGSLALAREFAPDGAVRVIAFAVADDDHALVACIEAGVAGYIARDGTLHDVVEAVRSVGRGETICSPRLAASLFRRLAVLERERRSTSVSDRSDSDDISLLSARERQVLSLLDQGLANKEIASRLNVEVATVKQHVHRILEKLHVRRRGQAVARARHGARSI